MFHGHISVKRARHELGLPEIGADQTDGSMSKLEMNWVNSISRQLHSGFKSIFTKVTNLWSCIFQELVQKLFLPSYVRLVIIRNGPATQSLFKRRSRWAILIQPCSAGQPVMVIGSYFISGNK